MKLLHLAILFSLTAFASSLAAQPVIDVHEGNGGGPVIGLAAPATGTARDFGPQDINAGATASIVIYIGNTGTAPLVMSIPVIQGTHPNDFTRDTSGFSNTVLPGAYTSFTVAFDPISVGVKFGQVTFTQNDPALPTTIYTFEVRGQGVDNGTVEINQLHVPPAGRVDTSYPVFAFQVGGGIGPYSWALNSGSLPPGVFLSPSGSLGGTVNGNPGIYNFTVACTDSIGRMDIEAFTIAITDPQGGIPPQANAFPNESSSTTCSAGETASASALFVLALLAMAALRRKAKRV